MNQPFHIVMDMHTVQREKLESIVKITEYIDLICQSYNLNQIGRPVCHKFDGEGGITATQILGESLIGIHTYPEHGSIYIDIFSCWPFDIAGIIEFTKHYFDSACIYMSRVKRMNLKDISYNKKVSPVTM